MSCDDVNGSLSLLQAFVLAMRPVEKSGDVESCRTVELGADQLIAGRGEASW